MLNRFNVILNSDKRVNNSPVNNADFHFNFDQFESCNYKVTFKFSGVITSAIGTSIELPLLQVALGQYTSFTPGKQSSNTIGMLSSYTQNGKPLVIGNSNDFLQTLYISLPQNQISVRIVQYDEKTPWLDVNGFILLEKFILIMSFEKVTVE